MKVVTCIIGLILGFVVVLDVNAYSPSNFDFSAYTYQPLDTIKQRIVVGAFGETTIFDPFYGEDVEEPSKINYYRKPKALPRDYTGFTIELFKVYHKPLSDTDELFAEYGNIFVEQADENTYVYYLGDFPLERTVVDVHEKIYKLKFPDSKIVKYKNGLRKRFKVK